MTNLQRRIAVSVALGAAVLSAACSTYRETGSAAVDERSQLATDAEATIQRFKDKDPSLRKFFDSAPAMAVYPVVAKGGALIGGAHGNGVAYDHGRIVGFTEVAQGTVGVQLGGQTYSELIFFQNDAAFENFKTGKLKFQAGASAVATESGAAASSDFASGVAVFTMPRAGLMFEAAIGGQQFSFTPKTELAGEGMDK